MTNSIYVRVQIRTSISFLGMLYDIRSLFSFCLSLYFFSSQYFLVFLSVCSAHQGSCHLKGLGLRKFRLQTRQEKKAKKMRRWRKSDVCAPALDSFSRGAFRLSLSLCLVLFSLFYFPLCVSGFTLFFFLPSLPSRCLWLCISRFPPLVVSVWRGKMQGRSCRHWRWHRWCSRAHWQWGLEARPSAFACVCEQCGGFGVCACVEALVNSSLNSK